MQFEELTVNYIPGSSDDEIENGPVEALRVDEMRRVCLLSHKTYAAGDEQIWGKRYFGRG